VGESAAVVCWYHAASLPISRDDFLAVIELLGEDVDALPSPIEQQAVTAEMISEMEKKYINASPEVKARVSKTIERGPIGSLVKSANGFRCQLCEALGLEPLGFKKRSGGAYVEAHSRHAGGQAGGGLAVGLEHHDGLRKSPPAMPLWGCNRRNQRTHFELTIDGRKVSVARFAT
jgi:hypothetical protein